jgi:hypothetical protein
VAESLRDTVARECARCESIVVGWVARDLAFAVQTVVGLKRRLKKGDDGEWTYVTPEYVNSKQYKEAAAAVARIRELHPEVPEVCGTLVSYAYKPGGQFVEVFRRSR